MTGIVRKFCFDTVFDGGGDVIARAPRPRAALTPEEVAAERADAYAEGQQSAVAQAEAEAASALQRIAADVAAALSHLAQTVQAHRVGAAGLAMAAARRIADAALDRFPEAPVAAALEGLALEVESAPRLVVRTAPDLVDRIQAALDGVAEQIGYPGQLTVKADPSLPGAAFTFDWGEGRAAFDPAVASARVGEALERALAAETPQADPLTARTESLHA